MAPTKSKRDKRTEDGQTNKLMDDGRSDPFMALCWRKKSLSQQLEQFTFVSFRFYFVYFRFVLVSFLYFCKKNLFVFVLFVSYYYEWFPWSICNGCGMPAVNACPSGHLVPSPFLGLACAPIVETIFHELVMSLLDFSP